MAKYQGHKNWNHWNVSLWVNNDEGLYKLACECIRNSANRDAAARLMLESLGEMGKAETPDGHRIAWQPYGRQWLGCSYNRRYFAECRRLYQQKE